MKLIYREKISDWQRITHIFGAKIKYDKQYNKDTRDINYCIDFGIIKLRYTKKYKKKKLNLSKITRAYKKDTLLYAKCIRNLFSKLDTIETIILGASAARAGFIEDEKTINLAIDSQDLYYSYMLYKKYRDVIPNLKNVVVYYPPYCAGHQLEKSPQAYRCAYYSYFFDIPYKNKLLMIKNSVADFEKKLNKTDDYVKKHLDEIPKDIMPFGGYAPIKDSDIEPFVLKELKTASSNLATQYLKSLIKDCKRNNINVIIILGARNPISLKYYHKNANFFSYPLKMEKEFDNVTIMDLFNSNMFTKEEFYDITHLNLEGAKKLTSKLNELLSTRKGGVRKVYDIRLFYFLQRA